MNQILVIRGGAIGDFILTLPTLAALRERFPDSHLEILGYKHIIALADRRFYANATRSIEYGPLASFFAKDSELCGELTKYFASFDLVISYLFDPDGIFVANLARSGTKRVVCGPSRITGKAHAARQLAEPLDELGITLATSAAVFHPAAADREFARLFLESLTLPLVALHPGSGSTSKNWLLDRWSELAQQLLVMNASVSLILIGGEADRAAIQSLRDVLPPNRRAIAEDLPLPHVGAVLGSCDLFIGHDSGISHLAAATGTNCLLLFGRTDPAVWAPANENARVLRARGGDMTNITTDQVVRAAQELMRIGIST
jgi:heptosyltransferase-2